MHEFWAEYLLIISILFLAGLTQGALGFGFGIVAITLLPLVLGLRDAVSLMAPMNLMAMGISFYLTRKGFSWKTARHMIIWGILGVPVGVFMLAEFSESIMIRIFGFFLLFASISHFAVPGRLKSNTTPARDSFAGCLSGVLAGAFAMGGPPLVIYLYSRDWPLERIKSAMISVYFSTSVMRLLFVGVSAEDPRRTILLFLAAALPVALFLRTGAVLAQKLPATRLRKGVFVYLGIVGVAYLLGWR